MAYNVTIWMDDDCFEKKISQNTNSSNYSSAINVTSSAMLHFQFKPLDIILLFFYPLVTILGVGGNLYVIKWFYSKERRKMAGSALVVVLAFNDLLASITVPSTQIHHIISHNKQPYGSWYLGKILCHTLHESGVVFLLATSWILIAIALERYK